TVKPAPSHRRNEPMYLEHIAREVARDRGESFEQLAAATSATARAFFALRAPR
ncbi:MAG TPA: hydrolase TatD, partial [Xanthomonadales bacterium]|nr:hydrolase TatD [Xanthomonadales bacterium]